MKESFRVILRDGKKQVEDYKQKVRGVINKADFTADTELEREAIKIKLKRELELE